MQVCRHDRVECTGFERHPCGHRIDEHLIPGDVWKFPRHLGCDLIPHDHSVALGIRFRYDSQELARTGTCQSEGEPHDSGHSHPRVDGNLRADFLG